MSKIKIPETSLEAYRALKQEKLSKDYNDIVAALKVLGTATYEEMALFYGWIDINKCSRRLKELEPPTPSNPKGLNLIFKTGNKRLTKRNRNAFVYQLTGTQPKTEAQEGNVFKKGEKCFTDYTKEMIKSSQLSLL